MTRVIIVLLLSLMPICATKAALLQFDFVGVLTNDIPDHNSEFSGWIIVDSDAEQIEAVFSSSGDSDYFWLRSDPMIEGAWDLPWFVYDDDLGSFVLVIEGFTRGASRPDNLFDIYLDIELEGSDEALENSEFENMYVAEFGAFGNFIRGDDDSEAYFGDISLKVVDSIPNIATPATSAVVLTVLMLLGLLGQRYRQ
ncbi:hypothetical protein EZV61_04250 [Corallincola luteus]|uniref:Uncharacterized protein n=2 Tax=Corallincola TaxID=1775176 RepID=A0A368NGF5_9GAMM|nr:MULTISPECIES: hypothetical protein [Corallincola]RCU49200.1 hypothetical protein DU002_12680 [Corallincola holothuriorum]TCI05181.1 hypothetical protein EZV61_04250 [Corallincola luteus]